MYQLMDYTLYDMYQSTNRLSGNQYIKSPSINQSDHTADILYMTLLYHCTFIYIYIYIYTVVPRSQNFRIYKHQRRLDIQSASIYTLFYTKISNHAYTCFDIQTLDIQTASVLDMLRNPDTQYLDFRMS